MVANGQAAKTPLYDRETLDRGQSVDGPAIIREPTGTVIVEPGWRARVDAFENLVLDRAIPRKGRVPVPY